jgi:hypothetical protein
MKDAEAQLKAPTQLTEPLKIKQDLNQGNGPAPSLFNLPLENLIRELSMLRELYNMILHKLSDMQMICLLSKDC